MKKFSILFLVVFFLFLTSCGKNVIYNDDPVVKEKITIMFDGNGGILVSGEENQKIEKSSDIIPPTYIREGYTFKGWNVDISTITSDKIVKAEWEEIEIPKFTIMFDGNGGSLISGEEIQKVEKASDIKLPSYEREGYTFKGWNVDISTITSDKIVKAEWEEIEVYKIVKFNPNGGNLSSEEIQNVRDGKQVSMPIDPTKEGYTFDGWYLGDEKWSFASNIVTVDLTLTAHWKVNQYTLTIKYNDGVTSDLVIRQNYNSAITVTEPTKLGYTFDKWSETIPSTMPAEDKTIEANWKINQYTLTIKYNDGITSNKVITQDYNSSVSLDNPTRLGYTFEKWSENITLMPAENKTIEALWKVNQYTLTIKYNDGVTQDKIITQDYETVISIETPTRIGYTFDKWSETISITMPAENKVIEANWKVNQYTLTIKYNDGVTSNKVITQDYNSSVSLDNPTRLGYTFEKWSENITLMPAENKIIEASWICDVKYIIIDNEVHIIGYNKTDNIIILDKYENYPTIIIESNAFKDCTSLTSIIISENVTHIGDSAFDNCPIENVTLPTFAASKINKSKLKSVIINSGTYIDSYAFKGCSLLTSIVLPNSVTSIGNYAFSGCTSLTDITIPNGVTSIGNQAFSDCTSLKSITIPDSVSIINQNAFINCTSLTDITIGKGITRMYGNFNCCPNLKNVYIEDLSKWCSIVFDEYSNPLNYAENLYINNNLAKNITIPDGVTSIGNHAFEGYTLLTSITIPNSVTSIGNYAFSGCTSLTSIIIPNSVTSIGKSAFGGCNSLTSITIPNSVTSIGNSAFYYCTSLTDITIPNGVTSIGNNAFYYCTSLTSITIPNSVTSIGNSAFYYCTSLTSITIPNSVTSIGYDAFYYCTSLTSITIPNSVTSIGNSAFSYCNSLTSITIPFVGDKLNNPTKTHFGYIFGAETYSENSTKVPNSLKDVVITCGTSIGDSAFEDCTSLTGITIPNSVLSIGYRTFYNCESISSITIPNSVTSIGYDAFYGCIGVTNIIVVENNLVYDSRENCNAIIETSTNTLVVGCKNTIIPNSVTSIGNYAFSGCTSLTDITIPNGVTSIGNQAFYNCTSLTSITIPNSVTSIGNSAFYYCTSLTDITIPNSVTSIGNNAFYYCSSLTSITIPNSVTSIGNNAFYYCTSLTSIIIPNSVTSIGKSAFGGCNSLTSITIPFVGDKLNNPTKTHFGYIFGAETYSNNSIKVPNSLKKVVITDGTSIGDYAFSGCTSLTDITIPDIVTSIGAYAFESCKLLSSIIIPNSVISIDAYAFKDCALTILCEATTKPLGWSILWNIGNDSVVWGYKGI